MTKEQRQNQKDIDALIEDLKQLHTFIPDLIEEIEKPKKDRASIGDLMLNLKSEVLEIFDNHLKLYPENINP